MSAYLTEAEIRAEFKRGNITYKEARNEISIALDYWNRCLYHYQITSEEQLGKARERNYTPDIIVEIRKAFKEIKFLHSLNSELCKLYGNEELSLEKVIVNSRKNDELWGDNTLDRGVELTTAQTSDTSAPAEHSKIFRRGIDELHLEAVGKEKYRVLSSLARYFRFIIDEVDRTKITLSVFEGRLIKKKTGELYKKSSIEKEIKNAKE